MFFFLSDLMGELEPRNRGLDPSGLEESDFLEDEKNLPLNTIGTAFLVLTAVWRKCSESVQALA